MSQSKEVEEVKPQGVNRRQFLVSAALGAGAAALTRAISASAPATRTSSPPHASSSAWSFGVMADTQWIAADDGSDPNGVAVDIISQINRQFIARKVDFVVQVGDLCEKGSNVNLGTRALYAQDLYNAGIGFYPLRGNHESKQEDAQEFVRFWPQTKTGKHNTTPDDVFHVVGLDAKPPAAKGSPFTLGKILGSPDPDGNGNLQGLSYAFDYLNARFVLLDQFVPHDGGSVSAPYSLDTTIGKQQHWIDSQLTTRPAGTHAFVLGHKGLITENHVDTLFGENPFENPGLQDAFIKSLADNNVKYYMHGHDHMHDRSIVRTTDGVSGKVTQLLCSSDSSKFYIPAALSNDNHYDEPAAPNGFGHLRQTPLSQELNTVGFYIFTVRGSAVTADFYSADVYPTLRRKEYLITKTPTLNFVKRETFGYGLNGQEFLVNPGESYTAVQDKSSAGTTARILSGTNGRNVKDGSNRPCANAVNTAWTARTMHTASDILTLSGMARNMSSDQTDVYALSMSYFDSGTPKAALKSSAFALASMDSEGNWGKAASTQFVLGPWNAGYPLGTYGIDNATNTAWAVINCNGVFAVVHNV
jgi:hypothetical protein